MAGKDYSAVSIYLAYFTGRGIKYIENVGGGVMKRVLF
jgi:hypothetical protein